jgi:hypothetical protein
MSLLNQVDKFQKLIADSETVTRCGQKASDKVGSTEISEGLGTLWDYRAS